MQRKYIKASIHTSGKFAAHQSYTKYALNSQDDGEGREGVGPMSLSCSGLLLSTAYP